MLLHSRHQFQAPPVEVDVIRWIQLWLGQVWAALSQGVRHMPASDRTPKMAAPASSPACTICPSPAILFWP